ncbi:MAG TPA: hypothetical protein VJ343_01055 [archaeon]|nr:hypothetical protein [archaeon]
MLNPDWLNKGTVYFKRRSEKVFNIIPGSSILLGLFDPYPFVYNYGHDREWTEDFVGRLAETFGYDRKSLFYPSVKFEHPYNGEDEVTFLVKSGTDENKQYKVTLRNVARVGDSIETKLKSLRNLKHSCGCERSFETDIICSMPIEACKAWGISDEEYGRSFAEKDKIYGEKICKHESRALSLLRYPLFDKVRFHTRVLPLVMRDLGKKESWKQEDIDVVVRSYLVEMGWIEALNYMKQLHRLEESLENAERVF